LLILRRFKFADTMSASGEAYFPSDRFWSKKDLRDRAEGKHDAHAAK
jgi:hypothetical protein